MATNPSQREGRAGAPGLAAYGLIAIATLFMVSFLILPVVLVLVRAGNQDWPSISETLTDPDCLSAIRLTLTIASIAVPANMVFGLAASWAITKFSFPGRSLLITLIDLPFSVSPVVSGLIYALVFGMQGYLGPWLRYPGSFLPRSS